MPAIAGHGPWAVGPAPGIIYTAGLGPTALGPAQWPAKAGVSQQAGISSYVSLALGLRPHAGPRANRLMPCVSGFHI